MSGHTAAPPPAHDRDHSGHHDHSHALVGASSVNELADAVGMDPSAVSHQLRVLRHLRFVVGRREGRRVVYDLHDDHIAHLLDEAISHVEHVQLGLAGRSTERQTTELGV